MGGYSWGDDTGTSGGDGFHSSFGATFESARAAYKEPKKAPPPKEEKKRPRYSGGKTPSPVGKNLFTQSSHPLVVGLDLTGSMKEKPGIILEKLALLGNEAKRYAPDYAISFIGIGDAHEHDEYPLQARDFKSGSALDRELAQIYPEGEGGRYPEGYGLIAYYCIHHCEMPCAERPVMVLILDAISHRYVEPFEVKEHTGDDIESHLKTSDLFAELQKKFSLYIILFDGKNSNAHNHWKKVVNPQRIILAKEPRDIVEMIIGIYASEMEQMEDFMSSMSARHDDKPDRVDRVTDSLSHLAKSGKIDWF